MIRSMTGYGSGSHQQDDLTVLVEVRTVNHRFLDVHVRLGREYAFLETEVQKAVRAAIERGRVDVSINIRTERKPERLLDAGLAKSYYEAALHLREELSLSEPPDLKTLLSLPGVVQDRDVCTSEGEDLGALQEAVRSCLDRAMQSVLQMRAQEGQALKTDMERYLSGIQEKNDSLKGLVPSAVGEYRTRLSDRLAQLLPPNTVEPQRLAQEVAILVERSDISEEIARLDSHLEQCNGLIEAGKEAGKKLDFLLQEMQREVNTVLSKTGSMEIKRLGIALKADIEKLREQVQNIE